MAEPPLLTGAAKVTLACASPGVAVPMVGAPGAVRMLTVCVLPLLYPKILSFHNSTAL